MMRLAQQERAELADFLATLSPEQWEHDTLCDGWRVHDVVAHIRRPLGLPRDIPAERLLPALRGALVAPPVGAFWRARGLRLVARLSRP